MSVERTHSPGVVDERWRRERESFVAAVRETLADERDRMADERERAADSREHELDLRERDVDDRERQLSGTEPVQSLERRAGRRQREAEARRRGEARRRVEDRALQAELAGRQDVAGRWDLGGDLARQFALLAAELYAEETLEAVLARIVRSAVTVVPGCDIATITFAHDGRYWTPVATDPAGERFDRAQYALGQGPCLDATESAICQMTDGWSRWPRLAEQFVSTPIAGVLSCRIAVGGGRARPQRAALNLYSTGSGGIRPDSYETATVLAAHASVAVATARERIATSESEAGFRQALASRQVIGQATGMLMERQRITAEDAFDILRRASQRMNIKLRQVAANLASSGQPLEEETQPPDYERLGRTLDYILDASRTVRPDRLPLLVGAAADRLGVTATTVFLADYAQRRLLPFGRGRGTEGFAIDGTVGGRAFISGEPVELQDPDGTVTMWVPLVDGVQRIGVVAFSVNRIDDDRRGVLTRVAELLAGEVVARGQYSDVVTNARRDRPLTLAADLTWDRTPPNTFATDHVSLAAALEPSYTVAGDAYDYAYNHPDLHLSLVDAVGHDLRAGFVANLAVSTYRHARRRGAGLQETAAQIDRAIREHAAEDSFATGILASLDVINGHLTFVNAGHPPPMLLRQGQIIGPLAAPRRPPLGLGDTIAAGRVGIGSAQLEPEDRVLFYTDGIIEARSATGEDFGLDRLQDFIRRHLTAGRTDAEFVRRLTHAVLDHHHGRVNDDATVVVLHWRSADTSSPDDAQAL